MLIPIEQGQRFRILSTPLWITFVLLVWLLSNIVDDAITLLFFLSLLYSYPVFGAPTAPRAFELLTHFKRSQFGTDLRQCSGFSDSVSIFLSFVITLFISFNLPLTWMGRCWLAKTNHMTIQADVVAEIHISCCLNANVSHTTLTYRHITKHICHYKPNSADCTAKKIFGGSVSS